ncbi:MAG: hypothetical protein AAFO95_13750 [Cyanobacteria bacterium J06600_6]
MSPITAQASKVAAQFHLDTNTFLVSLSEAEAKVIEQKAKRAGISINEYLRNAALGFPMGN